MNNCTCATEPFSSGPMLIQCDSCALTEFRAVLAAAAKGAANARRRANAAIASLAR